VTEGNLALLLDETASSHPDRVALTFEEWTLSYDELHDASSRLATVLAREGVGPGDRVALSCPNTPWFTVSYFAILKLGAVVVPLNVMLKASDVAFHLDLVEARILLCGQGVEDREAEVEARRGFEDSTAERFIVLTSAMCPTVDELSECATLGSLGWATAEPHTDTVHRGGGDLAALLFTSGTTGVPKAAELTHRNLRSNAQAGEVLFGTDSSNPDTYLAMLPLSHSFGQTVVQNTAVAFGATVVLMEHFEAGRALELLERHQVTLLAGVPTMYWSLCSAVTEEPVLASRTATLRMAVSGGASLPHQVHLDAQRLLGVTILEGYGLSETSPIASFSRLGYAPRVGSIGTPIPGVRMELLALDSWEVVTALDPDEVGEIAVCGPNVMRGYYRDPTATEAVLQDGWLRTGDVGRRDADGWFYVVDRASDVIIRGGYNVYPTEVEAVLWRHPDVDAVAVTGVPDDRLGEEIAAYVVLRPGADMAADDVVSWARERLPAYKYPRRVQFLPRLPVSPTGKVLKRALLRPVPVPAPRTSEAAAVGSDLTRAAGPEPSSSLAELRISEA
jgi:long-chain acyl-CoA synthetase